MITDERNGVSGGLNEWIALIEGKRQNLQRNYRGRNLFAAHFYLRKGKGEINLAVLHRGILFICVTVFFMSSYVMDNLNMENRIRHKDEVGCIILITTKPSLLYIFRMKFRGTRTCHWGSTLKGTPF